MLLKSTELARNISCSRQSNRVLYNFQNSRYDFLKTKERISKKGIIYFHFLESVLLSEALGALIALDIKCEDEDVKI